MLFRSPKFRHHVIECRGPLQAYWSSWRQEQQDSWLVLRGVELVRMYEPHEAREDAVLFPEFRKIVSRHEYDSFGEDFEKKENQLFGGEGFERNVDAVAAIEKRLGLYDLAQFTPQV